MAELVKPDGNGWYRVHAKDGSGLDYSTTLFDPEIHVIVGGDASDAHGNPYPAGDAPQPEEPSKSKQPEEAKK
jgi:hypothetical protein